MMNCGRLNTEDLAATPVFIRSGAAGRAKTPFRVPNRKRKGTDRIKQTPKMRRPLLRTFRPLFMNFAILIINTGCLTSKQHAPLYNARLASCRKR